MKTINDIAKNLEEFEKRFGLNVIGAEQGSGIWMNMKLGVISASNASKAIAKRDSDKRLTYMSELVAQVCTGIQEEISSKYLDWGSEHEMSARAAYELKTGYTVKPVCFVYKDNTYRTGCSPDGLVSDTKGCEIKTPYNAENYIKFLCEDFLKPEYVYQYQFTLWVMDGEEYDFVQYHPFMKRKPLHILNVKKDIEIHKKFDDLIPVFIEDMDKMLKKIGIKYGEQWERLSDKSP
jgi:hypothetical protein